MQVSLAFVQVQAALNWAALNYTRIAEWYASVSRVVALEEALEEVGEASELHAAAPRMVLTSMVEPRTSPKRVKRYSPRTKAKSVSATSRPRPPEKP